jgi:uncharacterized membrane protein YoaK (UPF0700 family)
MSSSSTDEDASVIARGALACVDTSLRTMLLPSVLSITAGSVDVISFLGLGGLFTAHITGNLVILAAHIATRRATPLAPILSVPVFIGALCLTRLAAIGLEASRHGSLKPLLTLQFLLLVGFLAFCGVNGSGPSPDAPTAIVGGMLGIAAIAVQNVLVQISLDRAPATGAMTTNITIFIIDLGAMLFRRDPGRVTQARTRAGHTWPAIAGFATGCTAGALCEATIGLRALVLPTGFALLALVLGLSVKTGGTKIDDFNRTCVSSSKV